MAKRNRFRVIVAILSMAILLAAVAAYLSYTWVQLDNVKAERPQELLIPTHSNFDTVAARLESQDLLHSVSSFQRVAGWMNFNDAAVKAGRYIIQPDWNNRTIINTLRSGRQTPVQVTIHNARTVADVSGKITRNLEIDSLKFLNHLLNPETLSNLQLNRQEVISLFIPNTYEVFWNISAVALVNRMQTENDKFWNTNNRKAKADSLGLTKVEVYTLASIVEKETQSPQERPKVAGLYINRLKRGIPLQADPTVVFGVGDFTLRRVLFKHLAHESPYNTYLNQGLPPGPIYMSAIESIDAVLDYEKHNYIYMCARPDYSGLHAFATDQAGHSRNARRYHQWLDKMGIK